MDPAEHAPKNLVDWLQARLAAGENVIFVDDDHSALLPRQIMANPALLKAITASGGTLIMEGPQTDNALVQQLYAGEISDDAYRRRVNSPYHANDPQRAATYATILQNITLHARDAGTRLFYPERETVYDAIARDPKLVRLFHVVATSLTSMACTDTQAPAVVASLPRGQDETVRVLTSLIDERSSTKENHAIAEGIRTQPAPYVISYGSGHAAALGKELAAVSIGLMESRDARYKVHPRDMPDYVYYADTGDLVSLAKGSPERTAFVTQNLNKGLSDEEKLACMNALPPPMRQALPVDDQSIIAPPPRVTSEPRAR